MIEWVLDFQGKEWITHRDQEAGAEWRGSRMSSSHASLSFEVIRKWWKVLIQAFQDLIPDDLRWTWHNNYRNKLHNKCDALKSSQNHSSSVCGKTALHEANPWCQKFWGPLSFKMTPDTSEVTLTSVPRMNWWTTAHEHSRSPFLSSRLSFCFS